MAGERIQDRKLVTGTVGGNDLIPLYSTSEDDAGACTVTKLVEEAAMIGPRGYSGYQGTSGYSGYSSYSGASGARGIQGISGYSGMIPPRVVMLKLATDTSSLGIGTGKVIFPIPSSLNGFNLTEVAGAVTTAATTGRPTYQIRNVTDTTVILTTPITIDATQFTSYTAATPPVIDTAYDGVSTGDMIAIDKTAAGTGEMGDTIILTFQLP